MSHVSLRLICSLLFTVAGVSSASTDIWLHDLDEKGNLIAKSSQNITDRVGYDNQPFFAADGKGIFYTKIFDDQADLFYYEFATQQHKNITRTKQSSEYSPTESPLSPKQLVTVKVEPDGTQRLWTVNTKTAQQQMLNRYIKPVGYFVWGKHQDLLMFVLDEPMKLKYASHFTHKSAITIDTNIGRSLRYNKKHDWFTYSKGDEEQQVIWQYDQNFSQTKKLIDLPERSQYYTWLDSATIITAKGSILFTWQLGTEQKWRKFADLSSHCQFGISRIAATSNKLATVCNEGKL